MHLRQSNKTVVTERIDPKTGYIIRRTVETPVRATRSRSKSMRQEIIDDITKLVQDLEIEYHFGNFVIKCLKNYKVTRAKKPKPRYFIEGKDTLTSMFIDKYHCPPLPNEVLTKEIGVIEGVLQRIDSLELDMHWKEKLFEEYNKLTTLKKFQERKK